MKRLEEKWIHIVQQQQRTRRKEENAPLRRQLQNIRLLAESTDDFLVLSKLNIYCTLLSYEHFHHPNQLVYRASEVRLIEAILPLAEELSTQHPIIAIYNHIRHLFEQLPQVDQNADERYQQVRQLVAAEIDYLHPKEGMELYSFLSNYCIYRMNTGAPHYRKELFLVNNALINLRYGPRGKKLDPLEAKIFRNMVVVALKLEEDELFQKLHTERLQTSKAQKGFQNRFEWTEQFIEAYAAKLPAKQRKAYQAYCKGLLLFYQGKFGAAHRALHQKLPRLHQAFFNLDIKILHLKVLFELYLKSPMVLDTDQIDIKHILEAYRGLIRDEKQRKKQLAYQLEHYAQFEPLLRSLYQFAYRYHKKYNTRDEAFRRSKEALRRNLQSAPFTYKNWMLEKLEAIG
ncbi:MAG: hypothetical protein AAFP19_01840 [Bacteroidota bacterium]